MGHPAKFSPYAPSCQFDSSESECAATSSEGPQLVVENTFLHFKEHEQKPVLARNNSAPAELTLKRINRNQSATELPRTSPEAIASMQDSLDVSAPSSVSSNIDTDAGTMQAPIDMDLCKKFKPQDLEVLNEFIFWTVDARKLKGGDRVAVSPRFELHGAYFRIMMLPKVTSHGKGGSSFRKSQGKGLLQLKCESNMQDSDLARIKFNLVVGSSKTNLADARGPVLHNYSKSGVAGLGQHEEVWDFERWVDPDAGTFVIGIEILL